MYFHYENGVERVAFSFMSCFENLLINSIMFSSSLLLEKSNFNYQRGNGSPISGADGGHWEVTGFSGNLKISLCEDRRLEDTQNLKCKDRRPKNYLVLTTEDLNSYL